MIELERGIRRSSGYLNYGIPQSTLPSGEEAAHYEAEKDPVWAATGLVGLGGRSSGVLELRVYYYWYEPDADKAAYYCSYAHALDDESGLKAEEEMTELLNSIVRALKSGKDRKKIPEDFGLEFIGTDDGFRYY